MCDLYIKHAIVLQIAPQGLQENMKKEKDCSVTIEFMAISPSPIAFFPSYGMIQITASMFSLPILNSPLLSAFPHPLKLLLSTPNNESNPILYSQSSLQGTCSLQR